MATPEQNARNVRSSGGGRDSGAPRREAYEGREAGGDDERPVRQRPNYVLALILALIVFALLIGVRVLWGGMGGRHQPPGGLQLEQTTPEPAPAPSN